MEEKCEITEQALLACVHLQLIKRPQLQFEIQQFWHVDLVQASPTLIGGIA